MKKLISLCILVLLVSVISRCTQKRAKVFQNDNVEAQKFEVDVSKDTVLKTSGGLLVSIKKGSLESPGGGKVVLKIKEALRLEDMIKGGLVTSAGGELLSSGGMFFIEPEDKAVKMVSPITISVPTTFMAEVSVYKGNENGKGEIDWTNPQPVTVPENPVAKGETLFKANCTSCHSITDKIIGPALAHISKLRDAEWLYQFTRNSQALIAGTMSELTESKMDSSLSDTSRSSNDLDTNRMKSDFYQYFSKCVFNANGKVPMPSYNLTREEISAIYEYIDSESDRLHLPIPKDELFRCSDSCFKYSLLREELDQQAMMLAIDNDARINQKHTAAPLPNASVANPITRPMRVLSTNVVKPEVFPAKYYQVNISTFGWYNLDILLKGLPGIVNSQLIVKIKGSLRGNLNVFMVIPSYTAFVDGGKIKGGDDEYGFYEDNGAVPLPQNTVVYVFAVGENDGGLVFGMTDFKASLNQTIVLEPASVKKEEMEAAIKKMGASDFELNVSKTKNADEIRAIDEKLKNLESLKPKNCDCNCGGVREGDVVVSK